jgi:hypothetical protein
MGQEHLDYLLCCKYDVDLRKSWRVCGWGVPAGLWLVTMDAWRCACRYETPVVWREAGEQVLKSEICWPCLVGWDVPCGDRPDRALGIIHNC